MNHASPALGIPLMGPEPREYLTNTMLDHCRKVVGELESTVNRAGKFVTQLPEPRPARTDSWKLSFVRNQEAQCEAHETCIGRWTDGWIRIGRTECRSASNPDAEHLQSATRELDALTESFARCA